MSESPTQFCVSTEPFPSWVVSAITLVVLVASELLPFVSKTDANGILHGILRFLSNIGDSRVSQVAAAAQ